MSTKLEIGNLSWNTSDDSLRVCFDDYGTVLDARVVRDPETGRSHGHGLVTLAGAHEAAAAEKESGIVELDGRKITIKKVEKKAEASA